MKIYLDDDSTDPRLITELRKRGHEIVEPSDVSLSGASDTHHFVYAIEKQLVILTRDAGDFRDLHLVVVVVASHGVHPGVLLVRFDNDPSKDMKPSGMAAAVDRIEASKRPLNNQLFVLNHWRK